MNQLIDIEKLLKELITQALLSPWLRAGKHGNHHPLAEYLHMCPREADKISKEMRELGMSYKDGRIILLRKEDVDAYMERYKEPSSKGGE